MTITDTFQFKKAPRGNINVSLYSPLKCEEISPGLIRIQCGKGNLILAFSNITPKVLIKTIEVEDAILKANWGDHLTLITLDYGTELSDGNCSLNFYRE